MKAPMNELNISCRLNRPRPPKDSSLFDFAKSDVALKVSKFHQSLPGYQPTPLVHLSGLANRLGIETLMVKDESQRFDLNAFKVLGASYAMAQFLGQKIGLSDDELTFDNLQAQSSQFQEITFVTATDGNHGRAVAWAANKFGCKSAVYLPKGSAPARLEAIKQMGAEASITHLNYDDTVGFAQQMAREKDWILLQDTSWEGYEEVPRHIMQGYFTLMTEYLSQESEIWPTHVFVQAGVGSLAGAILSFLFSFDERPTPQFIVIEPHGAPCLYESMRQSGGNPYKVQGELPTIMAGLACGEPSHLGLDVLKTASNAFISCNDDLARLGMRILGNPLPGDSTIISGESGAVPIGVVHELYSNENYSKIKEDLNLTHDSKILLFSTEGDTDPDAYREIVWGLES